MSFDPALVYVIETPSTMFPIVLPSASTTTAGLLSAADKAKLDMLIPGGGAYVTIQDEGVALPQQTILNFIGAGVTVTNDPGNNRTNVTIAALNLQAAYNTGNEFVVPAIGPPVLVTADVGTGFRVRATHPDSSDLLIFDIAPDQSGGGFGGAALSISGNQLPLSLDNGLLSFINFGPADAINIIYASPNITRGGAVWNGASSVFFGQRIRTDVTGIGTLALDVHHAFEVLIGGSNYSPITIGRIATASSNYVDINGLLTFSSTGNIISKYNGETTAGVGVPYERAIGKDVASSGAGAQSTTVATIASPVDGSYRISISVSSVAADASVTISVTFTDAINTTAQTFTPILTEAFGANAADSAVVVVRANNTTPLTVAITQSNQAGTKVSATIERIGS